MIEWGEEEDLVKKIKEDSQRGTTEDSEMIKDKKRKIQLWIWHFSSHGPPWLTVVSLSGGGSDNSKWEKRKENEQLLEETGANGSTLIS